MSTIEHTTQTPTLSKARSTQAQKIVRLLLLALGVVLLLATAGFLVWASTPLGPEPAAVAALQSSASVQVVEGDWISFTPIESQPTTGLILYPGGRVDARAYAPLARAVAEQGFFVAIARMPLNLAVFDPDQAAEIMAAHPQITHWAVGGHSLGGVMAADFAGNHLEAVDGLVLMASYPAGGADLAGSDLRVLSIYGSLDGVADIEAITAARARLPEAALFVEIEGGNHAGFGDYGSQPGDNPSAIPASEMLQQVVDNVVAWLVVLED